VTRAVVEKALEGHTEAIELLYKARGRVWPNIKRRAPPKTMKGHLGAINAILTEQYCVKVVADGGRQRAFKIQPANRPEWPDAPAPDPVDDAATQGRDTGVQGAAAYETELHDVVAEFLAAMDSITTPRPVV